jgi:hypothetical protein
MTGFGSMRGISDMSCLWLVHTARQNESTEISTTYNKMHYSESSIFKKLLLYRILITGT